MSSFFNVAIQMTNGLIELRKKNIIHGRINPDNIFIDEKTGGVKIGMPWLFEGGLAENIPNNSPLFLELLPFVPPEQTGRTGHQISHEADLYSLGAVFYYLLTGRPPIEGADPLEIIHKILTLPPQTIPSRNKKNYLPPPLLELISVLLNKDPHERYRNVHGLKYDLELCRNHRSLERSKKGEPLPLSISLRTKDFNPAPLFPEKLFGREKESRELIALYKKVKTGVSEILWVSGESGIGKSSLVRDLETHITGEKGFFVSGKFTGQASSLPYHAFREGVTSLVTELLVQKKKDGDFWRQKISSVLGDNGKVITDVIPELLPLLGPQAEITSLGAQETRNRFYLLFKEFVQIFASKNHPFVIFLDDAQWIDGASLGLLDLLSTSEELVGLFIICAYRSDEVGPSHILHPLLYRTGGKGKTQNKLLLHPLKKGGIEEIMADFLHTGKRGLMSLPSVILKKTGGNPFAIRQFISNHLRRKTFVLDLEKGWNWNADGLDASQSADNVGTYLKGSIESLSREHKKLIKYAALCEDSISAKKLALIYDHSVESIDRSLTQLTESGFFVKDGDRIRFSHDKILETARLIVSKTEFPALNLTLGKKLFQTLPEHEREVRIFEIANHLNSALSLLKTLKDRNFTKDVNIQAGYKAKKNIAFNAAALYFSTASELLPKNSWKTNYRETSSLYKELFECLLLAGNAEEARRVYDEVLKRVTTLLDKAVIRNLRMETLTAENNFTAAADVGMQILKELGEPLPDTDEAMAEEIKRMLTLAGKKKFTQALRGIAELPVISDDEEIFKMSVLSNICASAYNFNQNLFLCSLLKGVFLILERGLTEQSLFPIYGYALMRVVQGDYDFPYELGVEVKKKAAFINSRAVLKADFFNAAFIFPWKIQFRENDNLLEELVPAFQNHGDYLCAGYSGAHMAGHCFLQGGDTGYFIPRLTSMMAKMLAMKSMAMFEVVRLARQFYLNLEGKTTGSLTLSDSEFNEEKSLSEWNGPDYVIVKIYYFIVKGQLFLTHRKYREAFKMAEQASLASAAIPGNIIGTDIPFLKILSRICSYHAEKEKQAPMEVFNDIKEEWDSFKTLAHQCRPNLYHKYLLLSAEVNRLTGKLGEAMKNYNDAAEAARKGEFFLFEALTFELSARFYLDLGNIKTGQMYLTDAFQAYVRMGAESKASSLIEEFDLLEHFQRRIGDDQKKMVYLDLFDAAAVMKSSETVSFETTFRTMVEKLLQITVEAAGADRGILLIKVHNELKVGAEFYAEFDEKNTTESTVKKLGPVFPGSLVHEVERNLKPLALNEAEEFMKFEADTYFKKSKPKSLLCLPMLKQKKIVGLLYLENKRIDKVFSKTRIDLLTHLASQAAFSIENANLYEKLSQEIAGHKKTQGQLKRFSQKLVHTQELERQRISSELHDSLAQNLMLVKNFVRTGLKGEPQTGSPGFVNLKNAIDLLSQTLGQVREICYSLRPAQLDLLGLHRASTALVKRVSEACSVDIEINYNLGSLKVPKEREIHIFRVLQEGLNNMIKHSKANRGEVTIKKSANSVIIIISDNGKGFAGDHESFSGLGLQGIEERAGLWGGALKVWSKKNRGTRLTVNFPMPD